MLPWSSVGEPMAHCYLSGEWKGGLLTRGVLWSCYPNKPYHCLLKTRSSLTIYGMFLVEWGTEVRAFLLS